MVGADRAAINGVRAGELIWTMTNKIVSATKAGQIFVQRGCINIVHSQQRRRLKLMVCTRSRVSGVFCIPA